MVWFSVADLVRWVHWAQVSLQLLNAMEENQIASSREAQGSL